jgi:CRISPR type IV-associated protein Csf1
MQQYSPSHLVVNALSLKPDLGELTGQCSLCGTMTESGHDLNMSSSFTDWHYFAGPKNKDGIICECCSMLQANHSSKIVKMFHSRIRRSLVTASGQVYFLQKNSRLKWMLNNLPDEPFLMMNSSRNLAHFVHHVWKSLVSLDKKGFFLCDDQGNHFIRLNRIQEGGSDLTLKEEMLHHLMTSETKEEEAFHPSNEKYTTSKKQKRK